jgi:4'-phosphopantetheinyl transferase
MTSTPQAGLRIDVRECPRDPRLLGQSNFDECRIEEGEIHVWHASPGLLSSNLDFVKLLSPDEVERMERFHFDVDRKNFLFCRSMLRMLLASYLGTPPTELRFAYSAHGKPSLAAPFGDLEFNLSHTSGLALFGICRGQRIGLDVERIRKEFNVMEIAGRFFSSSEKRALAQMPGISSHDAFFHCWTRKEAFVKARGEGLSCPLDSFDVSVDPADEEISFTTRPDAAEARRWKLRSVNCFPEYAAALAVEYPHTGELRF